MGAGKTVSLEGSWASLVAQMVKNPPAMRETWVQSLVWEDPLEKGMVTHFSILVYRIPMDRGAWWAPVHGATKSQTRLSKFTEQAQREDQNAQGIIKDLGKYEGSEKIEI